MLEEYGVETLQGLVRAPAGVLSVLSVPTVNRWLSLYRLDQPRLLREPPATRFQAEYSMTAGSLICHLPT
ncbi:site-specific recombinase, phage integrase family [Escherichia coli TA447]|uniref:Site-specific recombinase, phage integrase family n=1 Tax=Escherichia coli TA447 TaxID=656447 RepID=A0A1X3ITD9_ECOLX|nr:site-specific recombinase, phage integrase family [Escherichia coli TA447]